MNNIKSYEDFLLESDTITGGLGDKKEDSDFDKDSLEQGIKVEMEHTTDKEVAKEITKDHLMEDPEYYTKLATIKDH